MAHTVYNELAMGATLTPAGARWSGWPCEWRDQGLVLEWFT